MAECRYCGNDHAPADLCRARRVHRRVFLITASAAAAGALLPAPALPAEPWIFNRADVQLIWIVNPDGLWERDLATGLYGLTSALRP